MSFCVCVCVCVCVHSYAHACMHVLCVFRTLHECMCVCVGMAVCIKERVVHKTGLQEYYKNNNFLYVLVRFCILTNYCTHTQHNEYLSFLHMRVWICFYFTDQ